MNNYEREKVREYEAAIRRAIAEHPTHKKYVGSILIDTSAAAALLGENQNNRAFIELLKACPRWKNGKRMMIAIPDIARALVERRGIC